MHVRPRSARDQVHAEVSVRTSPRTACGAARGAASLDHIEHNWPDIRSNRLRDSPLWVRVVVIDLSGYEGVG